MYCILKGLILAEKQKVEYLFFPIQNYLAWPVLSDVTRDYFFQRVLCSGIIISQNVLKLEIVSLSLL